MSEVRLRAETGRTTGTRPSRRLRQNGMVPATLYGSGIEAASISVDALQLRDALATEDGLGAVIRLQVEGETHRTMARQLQRHPTKDYILHVDFVKIDL